MMFSFFGALVSLSLLNRATAALQSNDLAYDDVIDFLSKGHIILRNVLPELREESFRAEHEYAKAEASKAFERFFIDFVDCNKPGMDFLERVESGDGPQAMKDCMDYKYQEQSGGLTEDSASENPFYQIVGLHEYSPQIRNVATGERFGAIVADLLQTERVRLYASRTFSKVPSQDDTMRLLFNHPTFMHADLSMVPLDTNEYLTLWCPTRNLTKEDSVLTYATGSHRDQAYQNWYHTGFVMVDEDEEEDEDEMQGEFEEQQQKRKNMEVKAGSGDVQQDEAGDEARRIEEEDNEINSDSNEFQRYKIEWYDDIAVGDCVAHHGWLLHGATSQVFKNGPRDALTFAYIDGDARKLASAEDRDGDEFLGEEEKQDQIMFRDWYFDVPDGAVVDHPKLPLAWPPQQKDEDKTATTTATS